MTEYQTIKKVPIYFESNNKPMSLSDRQSRIHLLLSLLLAQRFSDESKYEIFVVDCDDFTRSVSQASSQSCCILTHLLMIM